MRVALGAVLLSGGISCGLKTRDFFRPLDGAQLDDIDGPVWAPVMPLASITGPLRLSNIIYDVSDPAGSNGAAASGVNATTVRAIFGSTLLNGTAVGLRYTYPLGGIADGSYNLSLTATDNKGNVGTATRSISLDNTPPLVTFGLTPPATGQSNATTYPFTYSGTITDMNFGLATAGLYKLALNEVCGASTNTLATKGTGPGQFSDVQWDLSSAIRLNGSFSVSSTAYNGVPSGGSPVTARYCWQVHAEDLARDGTGVASPNVTTKTYSYDFIWMPVAPLTGSIIGKVTTSAGGVNGATVTIGTRPATTAADGSYRIDLLTPGATTVVVSNLPSGVTCTPSSQGATVVAGSDVVVNFACTGPLVFSITYPIPGTWVHDMPGVSSLVCQNIATNPPQANTSYSATLMGPGVQGNPVMTGMLSGTGTATLKGRIVLFGIYRWLITIASVTGTSPDVNVTAAAGTCP